MMLYRGGQSIEVERRRQRRIEQNIHLATFLILTR